MVKLSEAVKATVAANSAETSFDACEESSCYSADYDNEATETSGVTESDDKSNSEDGVGKDETKTIQKMRLFMVFVLIFAVAGALATFFYLRHLEMTKFEGQFNQDATKVLASIGATLDFTLASLDALVVGMVSHAKDSNQTWPFVTIPDFGVRAGKVRRLTNGYVLNIYAYIEDGQRNQWENYTAHHNWWVEEGLDIQEKDAAYTGPIVRDYETWDKIHDYDEFEKENPGEFGTDRDGPYLAWWQCTPVIPVDPPYNWDYMSWYNDDIKSILTTHRVSISAAYMIAYPNETDKIKDNEQEAEWIQDYIEPGANPFEPVVEFQYPIIADANEEMDMFSKGDYNPEEHQLGGFISMPMYFRDIIKDTLPFGSNGVVAVFENPCNPTFTYQINGPFAEYLGTGDFHDSEYNHLELASDMLDLRKYAVKSSTYSGIPVADDVCPYYIRVYPSDTMKDDFVSSTPIYISVIAGIVLLSFAAMFLVYDKSVQRRQIMVSDDAAKSAAVVNSMFPKGITKRLMEDQHISQNQRLKTFLSDGDAANLQVAKPIADLFPHTTVMIADISGFTAWSSTRDPSKVFLLLETLFQSFDALAKRRKVFKVESVADSYTCVTGLPVHQPTHAVILGRFASECLARFKFLTRHLETSLGPDTCDLKLKIGLHSGPVTAGVLRGDRARFQLFGDTVNTTTGLQRTCEPNRIQISSTTAALLKEAGKETWLERRTGMVTAGGRGGVETFWLTFTPPRVGSVASIASEHDIIVPRNLVSTDEKKKHTRLVNWMTELLLSHIKKVVARHESIGFKAAKDPSDLVYHTPEGMTCMDELAEVFNLPKFDKEAAAREKALSDIELSSTVVQQLKGVVSAIAAAYNDNPFHNWEHACHVSMSVDKLLGRIVAPDIEESVETKKRSSVASQLHDYTYGITSDPLSVLAIVFSALIHDVDHRGVSNMQLAKEDEDLGAKYKNKSIAEQNSMDIAWDILMRDEYAELRSTLFCTRSEMLRFRQVVVNIVLATDIFDKELNDLRKTRWNRAFAENKEESGLEKSTEQETNLRATVVIEYIMQASDVCHTMQHWHIYRKFNERLFLEMRAAFKAGRMAKDPAEFWYQGEIGFFDNYIIPMAGKLKECGVFGVTSDEVLNYALDNRAEWERRGEAVVAEMVQKDQQQADEDDWGLMDLEQSLPGIAEERRSAVHDIVDV